MDIRHPALAFGLLWLLASAPAQSEEPQQKTPNEAEVILQDSKKQDAETPQEIAECMKQWGGPNTQMTKEEWAASCRRTLRYFPENP